MIRHLIDIIDSNTNPVIVEKITIDNKYYNKIKVIFDQWVSGISPYSGPTYNIQRKNLIPLYLNKGASEEPSFEQHYFNDVTKLGKMLRPVIRSILIDDFKNSPSSLVIGKMEIPREQITNFTVPVEVFPENQSHQAAAGSQWQVQQTRRNPPEYKLTNSIDLSLSSNDYISLMNRAPQSKKIVQNLVLLLVHEVTHLIQGLRTPNFTVKRGYFSKNKDSYGYDDSTMLNKTEVEAYAEMFARSLADNNVPPNVFSMLVSLGQNEIFGTALVKDLDAYGLSQYYNFLKKAKSKITPDQADIAAKEQAWRRFIKKTYEKYQSYRKNS